jgi:hypothetical protein
MLVDIAGVRPLGRSVRAEPLSQQGKQVVLSLLSRPCCLCPSAVDPLKGGPGRRSQPPHDECLRHAQAGDASLWCRRGVVLRLDCAGPMPQRRARSHALLHPSPIPVPSQSHRRPIAALSLFGEGRSSRSRSVIPNPEGPRALEFRQVAVAPEGVCAPRALRTAWISVTR